MKASEFVKKFGWERSKKAIEMSAGDFSRAFDIDKGFIIVRRGELKRLVDSHELVEKLGGLSGAKGEYFEIVHSGKYKEFSPQQICIAIADVESCQ